MQVQPCDPGLYPTLATLDAVRTVYPRVAIEAMPMREQTDRAMAGERAARWIAGNVGTVQLGLAVLAV